MPSLSPFDTDQLKPDMSHVEYKDDKVVQSGETRTDLEGSSLTDVEEAAMRKRILWKVRCLTKLASCIADKRVS